MKSKGDPILDARALCEEKPLSYDDLFGSLIQMGWSKGVVGAAIDMADEIYIEKKDDGKFHPIAGDAKKQVETIIGKALKS